MRSAPTGRRAREPALGGVHRAAFDAALFTLAQHAQVAREGGDHQAVTPSEEDTERYVAGAGDFLAAVEQMLRADDEPE